MTVIDHLPPGPVDLVPNTTTMVSDDGTTQVWVTTNAAGHVVATDQRPSPGSVLAVSGANSAALHAKATQALVANAAFLANQSPTATDVRNQVQLLTREATAVIRLLLNQLDTTAGS